jgi:hypothetical protein
LSAPATIWRCGQLRRNASSSESVMKTINAAASGVGGPTLTSA